MILVTGASGRLASGVIGRLRERGADVVGGSRTPGDRMRRMDFDRPGELDFRGTDTLVLVSAGRGEDDVVIGRHTAAVAAARRDGVGHIVYTSVTTAGDHLVHAVSHRATERAIRESGLAWTILRNGMYAEAFAMLLNWGEDGALESPYGSGALAAAARDDLAEAAAVVAADPARPPRTWPGRWAWTGAQSGSAHSGSVCRRRRGWFPCSVRWRCPSRRTCATGSCPTRARTWPVCSAKPPATRSRSPPRSSGALGPSAHPDGLEVAEFADAGPLVAAEG